MISNLQCKAQKVGYHYVRSWNTCSNFFLRGQIIRSVQKKWCSFLTNCKNECGPECTRYICIVAVCKPGSQMNVSFNDAICFLKFTKKDLFIKSRLFANNPSLLDTQQFWGCGTFEKENNELVEMFRTTVLVKSTQWKSVLLSPQLRRSHKMWSTGLLHTNSTKILEPLDVK